MRFSANHRMRGATCTLHCFISGLGSHVFNNLREEAVTAAATNRCLCEFVSTFDRNRVKPIANGRNHVTVAVENPQAPRNRAQPTTASSLVTLLQGNVR